MADAVIVPHRRREVGTLAVDWWAVTFGTFGPVQAPPRSLYQM